jgi:hypothetical protein
MRARRTIVGVAGLGMLFLLGMTVQPLAAELAPFASPIAVHSSTRRVTWVRLVPATSPPARFAAANAYDPTTTSIVVFGGSPSSRANPPVHLGDTWTWNRGNWTEQLPRASPGARSESHMALDLKHQNAVLFGGCCDPMGGKFGDTWIWNGLTRTWRLAVPTGGGPLARIGAAIVYGDATESVILFGGCCDSTGGDLDDTWGWDGAT